MIIIIIIINDNNNNNNDYYYYYYAIWSKQVAGKSCQSSQLILPA